jgi:intein/homing endonuclease
MTKFMYEKMINEIFVKSSITMLNTIFVDGETMDFIIKEVGMREQMLKQLVMGATDEMLNPILAERESLKPKVTNIEDEIVEVFVNGVWDTSFEKTAHVEIFSVGEVCKVRKGDFDKFVDDLEVEGYDCYLCPAIFSHPDWSGVFQFKAS